MKKAFFTLWLLTQCSLTYAQGGFGLFTDPVARKVSPEIGSLGNYNGEGLVDLYTGKVNVQIPIYTIQTKDIKLPISLGYFQDGIKVNAKSSWVGLGFNLNFGSYIQRERKGQADELIGGRFQHISASIEAAEQGNTSDDVINKFVNLPYHSNDDGYYYQGIVHPELWAEYDAISFVVRAINTYHPQANTRYTIDSEPDIFRFNFLGEAGTFVLDRYGNPQIIEGDSNISIIPPIGPKGNNDAWIVTLPSGVQLRFPNNSTYIEQEDYRYLDEYLSAHGKVYADATRYTYLWWASQITSPSSEIITFDYQAANNVIDTIKQSRSFAAHDHEMEEYPTRTVNFEDGWVAPNSPNPTTHDFLPHSLPLPLFEYDEWSTAIAPKFISQINFPEGRIVFYQPANTYRRDLPGSKYLDHIDILDNNGSLVKKITPIYDYFMSNGNNDPDPKNYRLYLKGLSESGTDGAEKKYSFEYNTDYNLPNRNSVQQDYFGYFNNNQSNILIPSITVNNQQYVLGDRSFDANRMQANILKKVIYPTGGYSTLFYEMNDMFFSSSFGSPYPIGGLRVNMVKDFDGINLTTTNFSYSLGATPMVLYNPAFNFLDQEIIASTYPKLGAPSTTIVDQTVYFKIQNYPFSPFYMTKGGYVGYGQVEVTKQGNGKTVYSFTSPLDHPDLISDRIESPTHRHLILTSPPDFTHISRDEERGLLLSKQEFNESGSLIREEANSYDFSFLDNLAHPKVYGMFNATIPTATLQQPITEKMVSILDLYYYERKNVVLKTAVSTQVTAQGSMVETKNYLYDYRNQVINVSKLDSKGSRTSNSFTRSYDVSIDQDPGSIYQGMYEHNIISPVVTTTDSVGNRQTLFTRMNYGIFNNKYLPVSLEEKVGGAVIRSKALFNGYNSNGKLLEQQQPTGIKEGYLYGYRNQYLIADCKNASSTEFYFEGFEDSFSGGLQNNGGHTGSNYILGSYTASWTPPNSPVM